jgi:hypothetical protein
LGDDPFFTAFLRMLIEVLNLTHPNDRLTFICDDDEQMALPMYKLYRRVKLVDPDARSKLKGLCFADDEYLFALQAADMISFLIRREADKRFFNTPYDYDGCSVRSLLNRAPPKKGFGDVIFRLPTSKCWNSLPRT